jgi:hypothetical protein
MSYLDILTRAGKSPATDYHLFLLKGKSYSDIYLDFFSKALSDIRADIKVLEEELAEFEQRFGLSSKTVYAAYIRGEEPENDDWILDFGEWASAYQMWLTCRSEYREEIRKLSRRVPGLTSPIQ